MGTRDIEVIIFNLLPKSLLSACSLSIKSVLYHVLVVEITPLSVGDELDAVKLLGSLPLLGLWVEDVAFVVRDLDG